MTDELKGRQRLLRATKVSWTGLSWAWHEEEAFRIEAVLVVVLLPLALWLGHTGIERAVLVLSLLIVLIVELLNTAVEAAIDRIGSEHHPLSARAKDLGSAAVLLALLQIPVVWGLIWIGH